MCSVGMSPIACIRCGEVLEWHTMLSSRCRTTATSQVPGHPGDLTPPQCTSRVLDARSGPPRRSSRRAPLYPPQPKWAMCLQRLRDRRAPLGPTTPMSLAHPRRRLTGPRDRAPPYGMLGPPGRWVRARSEPPLPPWCPSSCMPSDRHRAPSHLRRHPSISPSLSGTYSRMGDGWVGGPFR